MIDEKILDTIFIHGDFEGSLRDFFKELALKVWNEGEGFSGKRPFGNSGWEYPVYVALIDAGIVPGTLDSDGFVEKCNIKEIKQFVTNLIVEYL